MNPDLTAKIARLLAQAGAAHHHFEQTVLNGVYDEAWPAWYAGYLLDNGLGELLAEQPSQEQLAQFLDHSNEARKQQTPEPAWADYTAEALVGWFIA